jgi:hypothetical protein
LPFRAHPPAAATIAAPSPSPGAWAGLFALLVLACLVPAAINGTPPVFYDTQGYLQNMLSFRPSHERAFGYGAWLRATGGMLSLWLPAVAQAVLSAWLVLRLLAWEAPGWPPRWRVPLLLGAVALLLAGPLPWLASWLMPDLFTGLVAVALLILALHGDRLPWWETAGLVAFLCGAATVHLTLPPLLAGLAIAAGVIAVLARPVRAAARRVALIALLAAAIGWGALTAANVITYGRTTASLGGSVFLFARLVDDGDVPAVLRPHCEAGAPWVACGYLDRLRGISTDDFLWRDWSPLPEMGWMSGWWPEAQQINAVLLPALWPEWLAGAVRRTAGQTVTFGLGDGMEAEGARMMARDIAKFGLPWLEPVAMGSAQHREALLPLVPAWLADPLSAAGLLLVLGFAALGLARRQPALWWPAGLFLLLWLGNAAVVALGAPVHHRYGTRLVWVAPLLALILAARLGAARRPAWASPAAAGLAPAASAGPAAARQAVAAPPDGTAGARREGRGWS